MSDIRHIEHNLNSNAENWRKVLQRFSTERLVDIGYRLSQTGSKELEQMEQTGEHPPADDLCYAELVFLATDSITRELIRREEVAALEGDSSDWPNT